ncbi:hypothetical protein [Halomarina pelagica]|uniref:hypothetical protein n=1 Tax=Halomarina pelagica TaxID=2961599 RepID=UPI0020C2FC72|nr:hypothetical protein [Halomarina sp. BND7]
MTGGVAADGDAHASDEASGHVGVTTLAGIVALVAIPVAPAYWYSWRENRVESTDRLDGLAVGLATLTAIVHLYLFFAHGETVMLLAGGGFVGAIVLFLLGANRRLLYLTGIPYTAVQLLLWINAGFPHATGIGLVDKLAQTALVGLLGYLYVADE